MFLLAPPTAATPPLSYPHPVITEVLYAVPTSAGDANRDGKRDSAGDEFVELINPHDRAINLRGYTLRDSATGKSQFRFTFPSVEVQPGQVVVVFNGNGATMKGNVGDSKAAPAKGNANFHGALVFDAKTASSRASWANKSDYVLLSSPDGSPLECVYWGDDKKPPAKTLVCEKAPAISHGSVQRSGEPEGNEQPDTAPSPGPDGAEPALTVPEKPGQGSAPDASGNPAPANEKRPPQNTQKGQQPASAGHPDAPRTTKPGSGSPTGYQRRQPPPSPTAASHRPRVPFGAFVAHPPSPQSVVGKVTDAPEGDPGILFSPGLYPLEEQVQQEDVTTDGSGTGSGNDLGGDHPGARPRTDQGPKKTERPDRTSGDPR